ncbi:response regulator transcription factor [Christensenellaceae bacterium OttesenSCG-928-K19]|nr:response regulator transcription factor [Christensenellaceae bacterium OttesenSCG-928-K19]
MANILIVEDNQNLRKLMRIHLENAGYSIFEAENGVDALEVMEQTHIHLMVVDIMMPKMDGFELTGELRSAKMTIPVLMVTARESLEDKRTGFKTGADDYMVKPVDMEELLLRVEALLRRAKISGKNILKIGDTKLDSDSLTVSKGDHIDVLPQKEFLLLHMLLSYPGKIFTRQMIMDEIWGYGSETDPRTVDVHIKRLREKFMDNATFSIETIRGLGYKAVINTPQKRASK